LSTRCSMFAGAVNCDSVSDGGRRWYWIKRRDLAGDHGIQGARSSRSGSRLFGGPLPGLTSCQPFVDILATVTYICCSAVGARVIPHGSPSGPHGFRPVGFPFSGGR
jgi:hypothetical protein